MAAQTVQQRHRVAPRCKLVSHKSVQVLDERQRGIQPLCERGLALIRAADK